jgi:hypothetical protein
MMFNNRTHPTEMRAAALGTLIPKKSGDKINTDKRDALKLARLLMNAYLTPKKISSLLSAALKYRWSAFAASSHGFFKII